MTLYNKAGGSGTRAIKSSYPVNSGLTAQIYNFMGYSMDSEEGQTGRQENLSPEEGSNVPRRNKAGLTGL
jgi:hypothetical protein